MRRRQAADRLQTGTVQCTVSGTCLQQGEQAPGGRTGLEADGQGDRQTFKQTGCQVY
jgi:hypothetical protein